MIERTPEQHEILGAYVDELALATAEGAERRAAGTKPHYLDDPGHRMAALRHLLKWLMGEEFDETGVRHTTKAAWRLLAISRQEENGRVIREHVEYGPTVEAGAAH